MNNITKVVKSHGLTLMEVASRMGVHVQAVKSAIGGNPSMRTLERIANAVGCDVSEFFVAPPTNVCPCCGKDLSIDVLPAANGGLDIRGAIKRHGLTQREVAERMSVDGYSITYQTFKGVLSMGNPTYKTMLRIANAIGCDVSEFFSNAVVCPHCGKVLTIKVNCLTNTK